MKKTRLLEIIREEINEALNVLVTNKKGETTTMPYNTPDEKKSVMNLKQDSNITNIETTAGQNIKEDDLNEIPDFGGQFDKQVAAKYGEEDTLEAATEKITNRVLSDKGLTKAEVAKMDIKELNSLLKDIRAFISQKKQTPEVAAALKKQTEFDDSGSKLQDNQTNKAILRALGFESKKGPKGPTKPKTEKPAKEKTPKGTAEKTPKTEPKNPESDEAPAGDTEMEKAARGRDDLTIQYRDVMDTYKKMKAEEGDKAALEYLKTKQNIVKAYKKAQTVTV